MFPEKPHDGAARGPWGLWPTLALSAGVFLGYMGIQLLTGGMFVQGFWLYDRFASSGPHVVRIEIPLQRCAGLITSLGVLVAAPLCIWLILMCIRRRRGPAPRLYLGLTRFSLRQFAVWLAALAVVALASGWFLERLGKHEPEVMLRVWRTAVVPPLLWLAVVIVGPVFEELFFRGFLFRGIEYSLLGRDGAIIITALVWALVHLQYDSYFMGQIFLMGIVLGYARARTGSTLLTIALHALNNLYSTIMMYYIIGHGS